MTSTTARSNPLSPRLGITTRTARFGLSTFAKTSNSRTAATGMPMPSSSRSNASRRSTRVPPIYGRRSSQFTKILYNISSEATTRQQQLLSGTAQVAGYLGLQAVKGLASNSQLKIHSLNVGGVYYIGLNTSKPPLTDVRVRQAIAYSFPHDQVVQTIYGNLAKQESTS